MRFFLVFPLMVIPVALYNILAISGSAFSTAAEIRARLDTDFQAIPMISGSIWQITPGHLLITLSLVMLFFEMIKSTSTDHTAVMNHAFSMVLFIICLVEFLMFPAFGTSVFFIIGLMALLDVMAGFMVTIASARRDFAVGDA
ncbi:hypothetical protein [Litorimonas haliclonae]|uniref:hypothetical protein n=1 Tax=Litorimonas haliclonae TaxID=2081977 RepID=UPI0039F01C2B